MLLNGQKYYFSNLKTLKSGYKNSIIAELSVYLHTKLIMFIK